MHLYRYLILFLFFSLPFIHGKLLPTFGIDLSFDVSGNFEFSKSIYFNVFSVIIFLSYVGSKKVGSIKVGLIEILLLGVLIISNVFSLSPLMSVIGDIEKGHTSLMYINLFGVYLILRNEKRAFLEKIIYASLLSALGVCLLGIKEYLYPTYNYGELGNRLLGSFGHPNYLAGYLLILLPTIRLFKSSVLKIGVYIVFLGVLFLCKSIVAIVIALLYLLYLIKPAGRYVSKSYLILCGAIFSIALMIYIIRYSPEKLHSFLSRFYLWETTLKIIFSDYKILIFGGGLETLPYYFNSFKSPELYIFENYGFTADRPHNLFLNIFYHFGILGISIFTYLTYIFIKYFKKSPTSLSVIVFLLYGVFHYFSISSYLFIILCFAFIYKDLNSTVYEKSLSKTSICIGFCILIISCIGGFFSLKLYQAEILMKDKNTLQALEHFPHPRYFRDSNDFESTIIYEKIHSQATLRKQITQVSKPENLCSELSIKYPSVENYFFCGEILESIGKIETSKAYYSKGLERLPDLWNDDSLYWDNYFIKKTITGNRFFSEKFGNIENILDKVKK